MNNNSEERRLMTYPTPYYHRMFVAYAFSKRCHKSSFLGTMIKNVIDNLPPSKIRELEEIYKNMNPEQKKRTGKIDE